MPLTKVTAGVFNVNDIFGFRNRIINGDMRIDQRNAGGSIGAITGSAYTLDRWAIIRVGGTSTLTPQQSTVAPTGFTNSLIVTAGSGATPAGTEERSLFQKIEGLNCADLAWGTANAQTVTLSFWVRSSVTGTFGVTLTNSAFNRSYVASYVINSANTWEQKTITIAGDTAGTWLTTNGVGISLYWDLGVGTTYSGSATGAWQGSGFEGLTGGTKLSATTGATFYITGVQLEKGSQSTPFDYRPYTTELQLCQRYLFCYRSSSIAEYVTLGHAATTSFAIHNFAFPVAVRVPPTGVTVSSASHFYALNGTTSVAPGTATSVVIESASTISGQVKTTVASGLTAGQGSYLYTQSASAVLFFTGCEL